MGCPWSQRASEGELQPAPLLVFAGLCSHPALKWLPGTQVPQGWPRAARMTHVSVVSPPRSQGGSAHRTPAHPQWLLHHQRAREER